MQKLIQIMMIFIKDRNSQNFYILKINLMILRKDILTQQKITK